MKGLCYLSNMVIPGVGTLIIKHWLSGIIQTVLSLVAWGMIVPAVRKLLIIGKDYKQTIEKASDGDFSTDPSKLFGDFLTDNILILVLGVIGAILLKVTLIWSQASAVKYFRELKEAEAQAVEIDQVEDDS